MFRLAANVLQRSFRSRVLQKTIPVYRTYSAPKSAPFSSSTAKPLINYSKTRTLSTAALFAVPLFAAGVFFASADENQTGDLTPEEYASLVAAEEEKLKKKAERRQRKKDKRRARREARKRLQEASKSENQTAASETTSSPTSDETESSQTPQTPNKTTTESIGATSANTTSTSESQDNDEEEAPVFPSKYVIVGGGPSAYNALKEILYVEPDAQILMVSDEEKYTPYDRCPLSKELWWNKNLEDSELLRYPNWRGDLYELEYQPRSFFDDPSKNVTFMSGRKVVDLDAGRHLITMDDGTQFKYEKCLLATGTQPTPLPMELPQKNISFLKTAKDFLDLHHMSLDPEIKHVTIVGNDEIGVDLVASLSIRNKATQSLETKKIAQVFPDSGILSHLFPEYFATKLNEQLGVYGVDLHPNVKIQSIVETPDAPHKMRIHLDDNTNVDTDHIVLSLGSTPNVDLARRAYLELDHVNGGIVVNAELEARTDLYVAGDAASYYDAHLGRRRVEGIDHAEISGKLAGLNMTGRNKPYTYQPMRWGVATPKTSYQGVGRCDSNLETVSVWQKGPNAPLVLSETDRTLVPDPNVPLSTEYEDKNSYERGVIYYMEGPKVVGVMMVNVTGQMDVAKRLVTFPREFPDLSRLRTQIYLGNKPREDEESQAAAL